MVDELTYQQVRKACPTTSLGFETLQELPAVKGIIGQDRAVEALQFGLDISDGGYNIFVAGIPGSGRTTAVEEFLQVRAQTQSVPPDWCYVNNFQEPYRPKALQLPAGQGRVFQGMVKNFIEQAGQNIRLAFDSDEYRQRRQATQEGLEQQQKQLLRQMEQRAEEEGFILEITPMGTGLIPVSEGKPIEQDAYLQLDAASRQDLDQRREELDTALKGTLREMRVLQKNLRDRVQQLNRDVARYAIEVLLEDLLEGYQELPEVVAYLKAMQDDMLDHIELFHKPSDRNESKDAQPPWETQTPLRKYEVNVIVDNGALEGAPVVIEQNPTHHELFGRVEKEAQFGALNTDFTLIRSGALHRANGGYLVLSAEEVLRNLLVWEGLKRAIRNNKIVIEELGERLGYIATRGLQPDPIPLEVKVVLIGRPMLYHLLHQWDEDFNELFKVKADFDTQMGRTDANIHNYLASVFRLCQKEGHRLLDQEAAAKIIEHSARLAGNQNKLSTHFADIADLVREANFWAQKDQVDHIGADHVEKAIEAKVYRSNLVQERIQEMIDEGTLLIATTGTAVGCINGLAVLSLGDYAFGRPSRITVSIGLGRGGIVDIEREAKLGGPLHTKGVLILSGYLVQQYAKDRPLSLSARLVFEQSYEGVDGDSASSTELYALLSALSGLPIRQGIAVTGSVNQHGGVQAIGGVNEKVEGFFEVCKARGLSGDQGVMIPHSNTRNLMLKEEVVEAVRANQFHIWPIATIDEGIEVLTGVEAGRRDEAGHFPADTVHALVDQRLEALANAMQQSETKGGEA